MNNNNYIAIFIICIIFYNILFVNKKYHRKHHKKHYKSYNKDYKIGSKKESKKRSKKRSKKESKKESKKGSKKGSKKESKKESKKRSKKESKKHYKKPIDQKKEFVIKQLKQLKQSLQNANNVTSTLIFDISSMPSINEQIHLISAFSTNKDENNFKGQFETFSKKLYSINENEIKNSNIIKTNFIDNNYNFAPLPTPLFENEITGIINAPMYAPIESINKLPLDIFLINQINATKNNSVSYLEQPLIIPKNKYIKFNLQDNKQNIDNITGICNNKYDN